MTMSSGNDDVLVLVYDLETTGFSPLPTNSKYNRIVQISAKALGSPPDDIFNAYVDPGFHEIPPKSFNVHKISMDVIREDGNRSLEDAMNGLFDYFKTKTYKTVILVAHNNDNFDEIVLRKEYPNLPPNIIFRDSLPLLRDLYKGLESYNLGNLYEHFYGERMGNEHRADDDVLGLEKIIHEKIMPLIDHDLVKNGIVPPKNTNALTSVRYIGNYRAQLICRKGYESRPALLAFANELNTKHKTNFDRWLKEEIRVSSVAHRMVILSHLLDIPLQDTKTLLTYVYGTRPEEDCLDEVDYYNKYRYVLGKQPPNPYVYGIGQNKVLKNITF